MIKQQLNDILQKEMDRKDFLRHVGIATVAVVGIPAIIKALNQIGDRPTLPKNLGYGSSVYGGGDTNHSQIKK